MEILFREILSQAFSCCLLRCGQQLKAKFWTCIKKFEFSLYTSCLLYAKNTKNNYVTFIGTIPRALDPAINETVNRKKLGKRLIKPDLSNAMTVKVG